MPIIIIKDALRASVEANSGGACTVLYDSKGFANYMRIIPKFRCEDIHATALGTGVHPAFIVGGVEKNEFFYPQYPAVNMDGLGVSQPGMAPYVSINFDNAKLACTNKGAGWHLASNWEWVAVVFWCIKNGIPLVRGNTYYGQSHASPFETGRRIDSGKPGDTAGANPAILNGSGPASWRHDNTFAGIDGLVGNVWEWQDGFKLVDGKIYMPADNNFNLAEANWPDTLVRIDASGSTSVISDAITSRNAGLSNTWNATTVKGGGYTPPVSMKQALICPYDTAANMGNVAGNLWVNNTNSPSFEALPLRGGGWIDASGCGLAALNLYDQRSSASAGIGFRPAFIG